MLPQFFFNVHETRDKSCGYECRAEYVSRYDYSPVKKNGNENQVCFLLDMMDQQKRYFSVNDHGGKLLPIQDTLIFIRQNMKKLIHRLEIYVPLLQIHYRKSVNILLIYNTITFLNECEHLKHYIALDENYETLCIVQNINLHQDVSCNSLLLKLHSECSCMSVSTVL